MTRTTTDAPLWILDKHGRWRCPAWRKFVRTLPCGCRDPRCPQCDHGSTERSPTVAAHLRFGPQVGMGVKPDDFLVYPLSRRIHEIFHAQGQQSVAWQLERVVDTLRAGFTAGALSFEPPVLDVPWF